MIDIGHAAKSDNVFLHKCKYTFKTIFDFNKPYESYNYSKEKQLFMTYCINFQNWTQKVGRSSVNLMIPLTAKISSSERKSFGKYWRRNQNLNL